MPSVKTSSKERVAGSNRHHNRKRHNPVPDEYATTPKIARADEEEAAASGTSDDPFREPTRASFYGDNNDTSSDDDIEIVGEVKPQAANAQPLPATTRTSTYSGRQSRIASTPTSKEKRFLEVCITVKFDNDEGDIDGTFSVLEGTTIASLLSRTLSEYRQAFTQNWPHVIVSKWNERFQRSFPIPASEFARKGCEDGGLYEAFFFVQAAPRHNKVFWYSVNMLPVQPKAERRQAKGRRRLQAATPASTPRSQEVKREEEDAESNVADSRLGHGDNAPSCQEEPSATALVAQFDAKQEIDDAVVDCIDIDGLAEEIVREGAKLEQADWSCSKGLDHVPSVVATTVDEAASNSVSTDDKSLAQSVPEHTVGTANNICSRGPLGVSVSAATSDSSFVRLVADSGAAGSSMPITSNLRSSKRPNRLKPSMLSCDSNRELVMSSKNLDDQAIPTNVAPLKSAVSLSRASARGNRTSETSSVVQQQDSVASESADATTQQSVDTTQPTETIEKQQKTSSRRRPHRRRRVARKPTFTRRIARKVTGAKAPTPVILKAIFQNRKFAFTSSTRDNRAGKPLFNKSEFRIPIELRGGTVIDDFKTLENGDEVYLIADTHYRTHKYMTALSLSVPCVHHTWITDCVEQDTLVDYKEYMLAAGEVVGPDGTTHEHEWKPQKGQLMAGKKVWIHSKDDSDPPETGFVQLWSPIIVAVGAKVLRDDDVPQNKVDLAQWIVSRNVDIILTDRSCESLIVEAMEAGESGAVVGNMWAIEALITGELPDATNARYRHNA